MCNFKELVCFHLFSIMIFTTLMDSKQALDIILNDESDWSDIDENETGMEDSDVKDNDRDLQ